MENIHDRIKKLRVSSLDLTLKQLAEIIGVSYGFIADIERGKNNPSYNFLKKINESFNVSIDWLLTGRGKMFLPSGTIPTENKVNDKGEPYDVINGNAETFPQVDRVEKIANTSWFENLSSNKKTLVAAIDEIDNDEFLDMAMKQMLFEVQMERAAKKKADEEKDSSLKQKGEAG